METSGLLLVSVFCNMQRTPQFGDKDTIFFLISHNSLGEIQGIQNFCIKSDAYQHNIHPKTNSRYSDKLYPNTCCHNVLLLTMILTSAFMYCCNIGVFCPCVLTVAVTIKFMLTYHRKNHIFYSSFASSEVKGVKEVITPYSRSGS